MIESNIRAPVLLNLSNSLRKKDKMLGKPRILSLFLNLFNKHEHSCKILYLSILINGVTSLPDMMSYDKQE